METLHQAAWRGLSVFSGISGNTAQKASGDFARHLLANFPSEPVSYLLARILRAYFPRYFTKMLVNTSSIHSAFCFI